ncbi:MAG TPA: zinc ribbon domain-containing protein [Anaerolineales bacterium]|nr:zinc ribbon domain-containing protein [Anaerolineales bacterium]
MRKFVILLVLLVMLMPLPAQAQNILALKTFNVQLWAEHDQPSMLVIYTFEVADEVSLPASIDLRLPSDGNITAVAYESGGSLLLADYANNPVENPDWQSITIFLTERTSYRVEYYQPLERDGDKRSFTFQWPGDHPVGNFDIEIQVPQDSTNVKTTPAIPFVQDQIFLSGGAMLSSMDEGENYQLTLEYARTSDAPSVLPPSGQQVEPLVPIDADTDGRVTLDNLPYVLGGFGAVLIVAALFYFLRSGSPRTQRKSRKRNTRSQSTASQTYCHECGTRAHEGDRFCRICGSKLRG